MERISNKTVFFQRSNSVVAAAAEEEERGFRLPVFFLTAKGVKIKPPDFSHIFFSSSSSPHPPIGQRWGLSFSGEQEVINPTNPICFSDNFHVGFCGRSKKKKRWWRKSCVCVCVCVRRTSHRLHGLRSSHITHPGLLSDSAAAARRRRPQPPPAAAAAAAAAATPSNPLLIYQHAYGIYCPSVL